MICGTGIDIVEIERVREAMARRPERFLRRLFTPQEIEYCCRAADPAPRLAARFAAKEAVLKALGTGLRRAKWREIEVSRDRFGKPSVRLAGGSKETAAQAGITAIYVSLSHSKEFAVAQAIAVSDAAGRAEA